MAIFFLRFYTWLCTWRFCPTPHCNQWSHIVVWIWSLHGSLSTFLLPLLLFHNPVKQNKMNIKDKALCHPKSNIKQPINILLLMEINRFIIVHTCAIIVMLFSHTSLYVYMFKNRVSGRLIQYFDCLTTLQSNKTCHLYTKSSLWHPLKEK